MRILTRLLGPALLSVAGIAAAGTAPDRPPADPPPAAPAPFNVLGREDAPVTIIEFSDLQCPFCARFATQTFPELRRRYIDTGRVRYAARDLPLPMHEFAMAAAVATRCAGEQGRFWEYREALFAMQEQLGRQPYAELAQRLNLDPQAFEACRGDGRQAAKVRADVQRARDNGIASTPSFVIGRLVNGAFEAETVSGAQPLEVFTAKIDALLEAAR